MIDAPEKIRPGTVEVELEGWGKPLRLVPSLTAATNLNRRYGGLANLMQKIGAYDLDAYVQIIAQGASVTEKGMRKLPEAVWQTGVVNLIVPLTTFVTILANGGRPVTPQSDDEPQEAAEGDDPLDE